MASVNKVIILGNVGRDPEVRYTPSGQAVANISLATSRKWKDKTSGDMHEETEWHRVVFFGRTAEVAGEYLRKGAACYIEGYLKTRKWTDKEGKDNYTTEVVAESLQLLGQREGGAPRDAEKPASKPAAKAPSKPAGGGFDDVDDSIPF